MNKGRIPGGQEVSEVEEWTWVRQCEGRASPCPGLATPTPGAAISSQAQHGNCTSSSQFTYFPLLLPFVNYEIMGLPSSRPSLESPSLSSSTNSELEMLISMQPRAQGTGETAGTHAPGIGAGLRRGLHFIFNLVSSIQ